MSAAISPAALIEQISQQKNNAPNLWFVTGESGSGKTQWCMELLSHALPAGLVVGGVISRAVIISGRKVAIDLLDVQHGESRRLAILHAWPGALPLSLTLHQSGQDMLPAAGRWRFDPVTIAWGNRILRASTAADLLFVDEIGNLEFRQKGGFQAAIQILDAATYRTACVTMRPKLLAEARQRWPTGRVGQDFRESTYP